MSITLDNLTTTVSTQLDSAMDAINNLNPSASPAEFSKAMLEAQMKMNTAQTAMTGASEVIKAMGEGQKGVAKNMSI